MIDALIIVINELARLLALHLPNCIYVSIGSCD